VGVTIRRRLASAGVLVRTFQATHNHLHEDIWHYTRLDTVCDLSSQTLCPTNCMMIVRKRLTRSDAFDQLLVAARNGSNEALGELLNQWRTYLLLMATQELGRDLSAKAGASDIVQDAFTRAHQSFAGFYGSSEAHLIAWLRQIVLHQILSVRQHFCRSQKRD